MSDEKKNDGGPAHMQAELNPYGHYHFKNGNLSVRDHFAGLAMQGILASIGFDEKKDIVKNPGFNTGEDIAIAAYGQADQMLKVRDQ